MVIFPDLVAFRPSALLMRIPAVPGSFSAQMPQYFFDYLDGTRAYPDDEGTKLPGLNEARAEALRAIGSIAKGKMPDGDRRDFQISSREDDGPVLMVVSLALRVESK